MNIQDQQVIQSLETYKDLFDHAHDLIHILHLDGSVIYVNKAWEKHLDYTQEEVQGKSIYSYVAGESREAFTHYRRNVVNGTIKDKEIIVTLQSKTGNKINVEGLISVKTNEGIPLYTRGFFRDITTRLRNENQLKLFNEELKERETNLQQLLTNAPDAVIVIDEESTITYWNPKATSIFGWTAQEVIGKKLTDTIVPPQHRQAHNNGLKRYVTTGEAHVLNKTVELTALNKDGIAFYISLTISNTRQNGKRAFIAFIRNIDAEKRNELELEKKQQELELSNKELEQFAYVASHDLQEPLRKIQFFTGFVLEDDSLNEQSRKHLEKVHDSAVRMKGLIKGLLEYSHLSQISLFFEQTDLNAITSNVLSDLELIIRQKEAIIEVGSLPAVEAIPMQISQLFSNLIGNGLKFSRPDTTPHIKITSSPLSIESIEAFPKLNTSKEYHQIIISDNGIGFEQQFSQKIFTIFQRLNQKTHYEGYGIGLAVCAKIVERHGGVIYAESQPNEGATFVVVLPATQDR